MLGMAEEFGFDTLLWDDDQSWSFPILAADEENGGKVLIEGGKIVTDVGYSDGLQTEKMNVPPPPPPPPSPPPPPAVKGKKRGAASAPAAASKHGSDDLGDEGNGGAGDSDDHELHIWTERERRKKMRNMFASLHALIPNIHPRADKSSIVDEAIVYIKELGLTLENLEKLKKERTARGDAKATRCDPSTDTQPKLAIQSREAFLAEQGSTSKQAVTLASPNPLFSGPEVPPTFKTWTSPNVILNVCGYDAHYNVCCPKKPGPGPLTAISYVMEKYNLEVVSAQVSSDRGTRMYTIHARTNVGAQQFPEALFLVEEIYKQAAAEIMLWLSS